MNFFEKLVKKINEAFKLTKEKTLKLSEELKLKNKISNLEDKVNKENQEIGEIVYEKMKVNEDASKEEIMPKCEEISKLNEEIEKAKVEILALKNIKKCSNCNEELAIDADFCSKCGAEQPKPENVEVVEEPEVEIQEAEVINEEVNQEETNHEEFNEEN